jgi:hypothetical protein
MRTIMCMLISSLSLCIGCTFARPVHQNATAGAVVIRILPTGLDVEGRRVTFDRARATLMKHGRCPKVVTAEASTPFSAVAETWQMLMSLGETAVYFRCGVSNETRSLPRYRLGPLVHPHAVPVTLMQRGYANLATSMDGLNTNEGRRQIVRLGDDSISVKSGELRERLSRLRTKDGNFVVYLDSLRCGTYGDFCEGLRTIYASGVLEAFWIVIESEGNS